MPTFFFLTLRLVSLFKFRRFFPNSCFWSSLVIFLLPCPLFIYFIYIHDQPYRIYRFYNLCRHYTLLCRDIMFFKCFAFHVFVKLPFRAYTHVFSIVYTHYPRPSYWIQYGLNWEFVYYLLLSTTVYYFTIRKNDKHFRIRLVGGATGGDYWMEQTSSISVSPLNAYQ